jgi:FAD/FMN-containing dehydrogenase
MFRGYVMDTVTTGGIEDFRASLRGKLLQPGDPDYDQARQIWNAMIDRRPAIIVRCAGAADVLASVNFARVNGLPLAIRGGGHNIAGSALCDDGLVIDLSCMRSVQVDPKRRRAYVEGGATLHDFDHEAQAYGLATPLGINSTTGVAGLTLGGGFGWLSRKFGLTVDNLLSANIVTADGRRLHASATEEPDLFWAIRGGGGNFGVVTNFEFALHPVGPQVSAGLMVFPLAQARTVLQQYRDYVDTMGDDISVWGVLRKAPPLPFLPAAVHGSEIVALALFSPLAPEAVHGVIERAGAVRSLAAGVRPAAGAGSAQLLEIA